MCEAMALLARTGRHLQRYENQFRLVAGCIPYRLKQNVEDHTQSLLNRLEVLMISSPNRHDLVFPKGGWENDETVHQAACREALEEAGVRGIIHELTKLGRVYFLLTKTGTHVHPSETMPDNCKERYCSVLLIKILQVEKEKELGIWEFRSKSRQNSCSLEGSCRGYMFALEVTEELDSWPEEATHKRIWVTVMEAWKLCRYEWMREALEKCLRVLSDQAAPSSPDLTCSVKPSEPELLDNLLNALC